MSDRWVVTRECTVWSLLLLAICGLRLPVGAQARQPSASVDVLIVYYSGTGNTRALAEAVRDGASSHPGAYVRLLSVDDVEASDLAQAEGLILGSPTYYANIAAPMKDFIDGWGSEDGVYLGDKVGGAFATGGGATGGKEHVVTSLLLAMLNAGMVIVGPLYEADGARFGYPGASAVTPEPGATLSDAEREEGRRLGRRVAAAAARYHQPP
jgi:NAD(P)H dehydrogenase (quinone)